MVNVASRSLSYFGLTLLVVALSYLPNQSHAHGRVSDGLVGVSIPSTPGLLTGGNRMVVDKAAAVRLGKALFWDGNVGSSGEACASCHFHAGADRRTHNQLSPGAIGRTFEVTGSGAIGGPNHTLVAADFPLYRFANPDDRTSAVIFSTDDVVGSAGVTQRTFDSIPPADSGSDVCTDVEDSIFHMGGVNIQQVTGRNAPSVINAAFNFRNFWDGRANNWFNGVSPWGARDPEGGVWVVKAGKPVRQALLLANASLASQAVGPALNEVEMSCAGRKFPELGKKLLDRRALESQIVDPEDSVLGETVHSSGNGLNVTYRELIQKAFNKRYWSAKTNTFGSENKDSQMEANFSLFFGLAIKLYEDTLISDQTRFDGGRDSNNVPIEYTDSEKRGLALFMDSHCANCHMGAVFTGAAHPQVYTSSASNVGVVNRSGFNEEADGVGVAISLFDVGFTITSVAPADYDQGLLADDPWGHPLSFTQQYLDTLSVPTQKMVDPVAILTCNLEVPFTNDFATSSLRTDPVSAKKCRKPGASKQVPTAQTVQTELQKPLQGRLSTLLSAAFKIPGLRNVELTGPYMHNGSMKSLEEVVEFYNRGGNHVGNPLHTETLIFPHAFNNQEKADLVAFLKTLTDDRVRWEKAPFEHPALRIVDGYGADGGERFIDLPAVGRNGRSTAQGPLKPFVEYLNP